jgi:hypothetical protein
MGRGIMAVTEEAGKGSSALAAALLHVRQRHWLPTDAMDRRAEGYAPATGPASMMGALPSCLERP